MRLLGLSMVEKGRRPRRLEGAEVGSRWFPEHLPKRFTSGEEELGVSKAEVEEDEGDVQEVCGGRFGGEDGEERGSAHIQPQALTEHSTETAEGSVVETFGVEHGGEGAAERVGAQGDVDAAAAQAGGGSGGGVPLVPRAPPEEVHDAEGEEELGVSKAEVDEVEEGGGRFG